tara:strand:- start:93 stop:227 length:135 start_codon:yes stop_codon:yes gene_type:complete
MDKPPPQLNLISGVIKIKGPIFKEQLMGTSSNVYSIPTVVLIPN